MGRFGFACRQHEDNWLVVQSRDDGRGVGGAPSILVLPDGLSCLGVEGNDRGPALVCRFAADIEDEFVFVDDGIGGVAEEVFWNLKLLHEIALPDHRA